MAGLKKMVLASTIFCVANSVTVAIAKSENSVLPDVKQSDIDAVFKSIGVDEPGCVASVMEEGSTLYQQGYGLANLEHQIPNTPDTVFRIASVSKQFTALSTIILAEEGKISLDDDIRKYVPEVPEYDKPITVRNLINHTSGIRDFLTLFFLKGYEDQDYYMEPEFFEMLASQKHLEFTPGEKMSYTNSGYVLQSIIIERVTGKTLAEFAKEKIFKPLEMRNTHFHNDITHLVPKRAYGYAAGKDGYKVAGTPQELIGDGGIFTTLGDLAKFNGDFYRGKVWRKNVKREMTTPGVLNDGGQAEFFPDIYYAGGLIIGKKRGIPYVRHAGQFAGFIADYIRFPEQKLGIAALCNADNLSAPDFTGEIADLYLKNFYTEQEKNDDDEDDNLDYRPIPKNLIEAMVGVYYNEDLDVAYEVAAEGGEPVLFVGTRRKRVSFSDLGIPVFLIGENVLGNSLIKFKLEMDEVDNVESFIFDFSVVTGLKFKRKS